MMQESQLAVLEASDTTFQNPPTQQPDINSEQDSINRAVALQLLSHAKVLAKRGSVPSDRRVTVKIWREGVVYTSDLYLCIAPLAEAYGMTKVMYGNGCYVTFYKQ